MSNFLDAPRYAAASARVRGRIGRLLTPAQWELLLEAPDLSTMVQNLSTTAYQPLLEQVGRAAMAQPDPSRIERWLWQYLATSYRAPLPFMPGATKDLVAWLWRRFEVDNLKMVLRGVERDIPPGRIRDTLVPLGDASGLPWESLSEASTVPDVVSRLAGRFYGRALEPALDRYRREGLLFVLEIRLDLAYARELLNLVEGLRGRDRREAERFTGTLIDSQNVLWAFRYRLYHDLSPEEILNYTLQRGVRVNTRILREIATGASVMTVLEEVWDGALPDLERLARHRDQQALVEAEAMFDRYFYRQAKKTLKGYPLHLGVILAYLVLQETEIGDLVSLIEGKASGWPADRIGPYLVSLGAEAGAPGGEGTG
jgi:V/A-type H+-transporting ATPase subunit C